jgi:hypothetical protein
MVPFGKMANIKADLATKYLHKGCMVYFVDKFKKQHSNGIHGHKK